ncbi:hypothetical protein D3C87_1362910 [compost metagenome]
MPCCWQAWASWVSWRAAASSRRDGRGVNGKAEASASVFFGNASGAIFKAIIVGTMGGRQTAVLINRTCIFPRYPIAYFILSVAGIAGQ